MKKKFLILFLIAFSGLLFQACETLDDDSSGGINNSVKVKKTSWWEFWSSGQDSY